ncbi:MAG: T9SS type A sorting domain-containing protein, partial [Chitinophagales bacterium]|nr:T9SS type A sorting domain-containing protein [Chitinophagales bacterium]
GPYPSAAITDAINGAPCLEGAAAETYCSSEGVISNEDWIDGVKFGSIIRVSGDDGGYFDGTGFSTNLKPGTLRTFKVSAGVIGGPHTEYFKIWIDWNHDLDFTDLGEEVYSASTVLTGTLAGTILVPLTATLGSTRMRVALKYNAMPSSCESFTYGEVEDYTVNISLLLPMELVAEDAAVSVFPNPSDGKCIIQWNDITGEYLHVEIFDLTGKVIKQDKFEIIAGSASFDLSEVTKGLYLLKATSSAGEIFTEEILRQ